MFEVLLWLFSYIQLRGVWIRGSLLVSYWRRQSLGLNVLLIIILGTITATLNNWRKMVFENGPHWRKQIAIFQPHSSRIRIGTLCKCLFGSFYLWTAFEKIASPLAAASADYFAWIYSSVMFSGMHVWFCKKFRHSLQFSSLSPRQFWLSNLINMFRSLKPNLHNPAFERCQDLWEGRLLLKKLSFLMFQVWRWSEIMSLNLHSFGDCRDRTAETDIKFFKAISFQC